MGGRAFALRPGEDAKVWTPTRPSEATRQHWEILISEICVGTGIPKILVFPSSIQGTVARADLDVANAFFAARSQAVIPKWLAVYYFWLEWAIRNNPRLSRLTYPADYRRASVRPPRAVNVDVGRNSAAMLAELEAGATNYDLIYSPLGLDYRLELTKLAEQLAFIRDLEKARGLPEGSIAARLKEQMPEPQGFTQ
jgi:hypothetical protein